MVDQLYGKWREGYFCRKCSEQLSTKDRTTDIICPYCGDNREPRIIKFKIRAIRPIYERRGWWRIKWWKQVGWEICNGKNEITGTLPMKQERKKYRSEK